MGIITFECYAIAFLNDKNNIIYGITEKKYLTKIK
jgi:hypothetical protein